MQHERSERPLTNSERLESAGLEANLKFLNSLSAAAFGSVSFHVHVSERRSLNCNLQEFADLAKEGTFVSATLKGSTRPATFQYALCIKQGEVEKQAEFYCAQNIGSVSALKKAYQAAFGKEFVPTYS